MTDASGPETIARLREVHLELMREWRLEEDSGKKAASAGHLRDRVRISGRDIGDPGERDEAQGILDYWTSAVAALPDQTYPAFAKLEPYVGEAGKLAGSNARRIFDELASEDERRVARSIFEDLLTKGPQGFERLGQRTRALLQQRIRSRLLDAVLSKFEASGAISRQAGEAPADDRFEVTDANLVSEWPRLGQWLSEREDYERKRDYLLRRAEQWAAGRRSAAYLATGKDLQEIERFSGETDTLDAFIAASTRGRWRSLIGYLALSVGLGCLILILLWRSLLYQGVKEDAELALAAPAAPPIDPRSDTPPPTASALSELALPELEGAVWLGSDERPQVASAIWRGAVVAPSVATGGTTYRVLGDINLRMGIPDPAGPYLSKPSKGVVPAGTLLTVVRPSQVYDRPTGKQYWAQVRVVPRVYVQYQGVADGAIAALRTQLAAMGFDVPSAQKIDTARGLRELRYFNAADRAIADFLLANLNSRGSAGAQKPFGCKSFAGSRASNRLALEIWLGGESARSPRPTSCP